MSGPAVGFTVTVHATVSLLTQRTRSMAASQMLNPVCKINLAHCAARRAPIALSDQSFSPQERSERHTREFDTALAWKNHRVTPYSYGEGKISYMSI